MNKGYLKLSEAEETPHCFASHDDDVRKEKPSKGYRRIARDYDGPANISRAYKHMHEASKINLSCRDCRLSFGLLHRRLFELLGDHQSLYPPNCCDSADGHLQCLSDWNQSLKRRMDWCAWDLCC
jgi:hypothetical protein